MKTRIVEATQSVKSGPNWGKFLISQFDTEWDYKSRIDPGAKLLERGCRWRDPGMFWVMDLQTREGAAFSPGGSARLDLSDHRVWVCVLFEPFLVWLYAWADIHGGLDPDALPDVVELPYAEPALVGHRRPGPPSSRVSA